MKRLLEDRDIFIYLGEKAFYSDECRNGLIEEAAEEEDNMENFNPLSENGEQGTGWAFTPPTTENMLWVCIGASFTLPWFYCIDHLGWAALPELKGRQHTGSAAAPDRRRDGIASRGWRLCINDVPHSPTCIYP
ncbi:hypothetical protein ZEAMMB73_Zm00001d043237 [Zea mays]|uniref:Uncharacterized protein n=1 Tax=Zea mays TaxID=4577 RepID=A0A1D6N9N3_MAIZE|nr:hypothetical protein ZEAMMB73_Zm00001d043237 [Zea mays]